MAQRVHVRYPVKISPYVLARIRKDPTCALARQALPSEAELIEEPGMTPDPFSEKSSRSSKVLKFESSEVPSTPPSTLHPPHFTPHGVVQRFPDRVLVMAYDQCAMNCRHCTRKGLLRNADVVRTPQQLTDVVAYVKAHPQVREVLLSGGDPMLLSDARLLTLVRAFAWLPQIDAVRIGTRIPATLPKRITPALAMKLGAFKKVWVNTQFNHASELTPEAIAACGVLVDAGIPVSNQSVLLRGINDSIEAMAELCAALQRARVRPYYVFLCDPIAGISHFRVPLAKARKIARELPLLLGGLALPRFVRDLPNTPCKQEM
jgi:lysine 2,3-aminomutase